jgi:NAD(P)-dependent dehydrogenase (short-subunit alcohol dehydrogenase family)
LESSFANVTAIQCDFSVPADVEALCEAVARFDLQVLINNAMTGFEQNYFHKLDPAHFTDSFQKNVVPAIRITQAALKQFRKAKFGKIITILSAAIINKPPIGWSEYVASKCYLLSLSKSWATENAAFNISANCISPAFMQTSLTGGTDERIIEDMLSKHPLKALLKVEEVADAVGYFVHASQHANGINLILNAAQDVI